MFRFVSFRFVSFGVNAIVMELNHYKNYNHQSKHEFKETLLQTHNRITLHEHTSILSYHFIQDLLLFIQKQIQHILCNDKTSRLLLYRFIYIHVYYIVWHDCYSQKKHGLLLLQQQQLLLSLWRGYQIDSIRCIHPHHPLL